MTDATGAQSAQNPTTLVPTLGQRIIEDVAGKAMASGAAVLVGYGLMPQSQEASFISIGSGILVACLAAAMTWARARFADARLRRAVTAPAATPVTK